MEVWLGRGGQLLEADGEVEVQLGRGGLMVRATVEMEMQLGRGGLTMGATAEGKLQLGRGGSIGGNSWSGGRSLTIKPVVILVEGIGYVHITFHRLIVFQFVPSDGPHPPPHLPGVIVSSCLSIFFLYSTLARSNIFLSSC